MSLAEEHHGVVVCVTVGVVVGVDAACYRPVFVRWMLATTADTAPLEEVVVDSKSESGSVATFVCADEDLSGDSYFTIGGFPLRILEVIAISVSSTDTSETSRPTSLPFNRRSAAD